MIIQQLPISAIKPYDRNPRKNDAAVAHVARSIREFGFRQPIVVDEARVIIAGHTRYRAALSLGMTHVPVHIATDLSPAQVKALRIADNKTAEYAEWDLGLLASELGDLKALDFNLDALAFDPKELDRLLPAPAAAPPDADALPALPAVPVTKRGDLWLLGRHRLLCGDARIAYDVERLMGGAKAGLCFTSPPYDRQRDYTQQSTEDRDWLGLMFGVFGHLPLVPDGQVFVNLGMVHDDGEWRPYWDPWISWMRSQGWRRFGWYVWDQGPGLPGDWNGRLAPSHEFVFHFNRKAAPAQKARECKHSGQAHGGRGQRDKAGTVRERHAGKAPVQDRAILDSVIRVNRQGASANANGHPAPFPAALPAYFLKSWPRSVYEPFCGSGTTLVAAEQENQTCYGMEISPQYCDGIISRWEKYTGRKATLSPNVPECTG